LTDLSSACLHHRLHHLRYYPHQQQQQQQQQQQRRRRVVPRQTELLRRQLALDTSAPRNADQARASQTGGKRAPRTSCSTKQGRMYLVGGLGPAQLNKSWA